MWEDLLGQFIALNERMKRCGLCSWEAVFKGVFEFTVRDVGVDLCGGHRGMTEEVANI